ncbi:glycoside hydrolase family protein [Solitalea lacus]|uniref:glycoside hydrolase family protein n=1 Tax=Solitalea lacus TaxID=2911172 RepID=UPI001EDA88E0|nr:glycoside hydrolase family protein [Solitalea lacus]UKJ09311.1 glycoside hydrolase family protein [Solitalea lacus]
MKIKSIFPLFSLLMLIVLKAGYAQDNLDFQPLLKEVDSSNIFYSNNHYTWCSSVIQGEDGKYHMFYSRWSHGKRSLDDDSMNYIFNGFRGWCKYSEIAHAVAEHINGPYKYTATLLKGDGNSTKWDRFTMHNPQIRKFGKYYYLYYISNSFDPTFKVKNDKKIDKDWAHWLKYNCTQAIGVIKAKSIKDLLEGKYEKPEQPLMRPDNINTFEVATNPTVTQGPDKRYYMMYKSRKPNVGNMTFYMAVSNKPDGPYSMLGEVFTSADMACEDPCMWYDKTNKRFYAAVKYYSHSQKLVPQFGALALVTSENGLNWKAAAHPLISLREMKMKDGKKVDLAHLERPFVVTDKKGKPIALFAAASIEEPTKGEMENPAFENNSFNVCFPIK